MRKREKAQVGLLSGCLVRITDMNISFIRFFLQKQLWSCGLIVWLSGEYKKHGFLTLFLCIAKTGPVVLLSGGDNG